MAIPKDIKKGKLDLAGLDGNAFAVIAAVRKALKRAGNSETTIDAVTAEMKASDYTHLIAVAGQVTESED